MYISIFTYAAGFFDLFTMIYLIMGTSTIAYNITEHPKTHHLAIHHVNFFKSLFSVSNISGKIAKVL